MKKTICALMVTFVCGACGSTNSSPTTGSGTSSGSVGGTTLTVADVAFYAVNANATTMQPAILYVALSSTSGLCADAQAHAAEPNGHLAVSTNTLAFSVASNGNSVTAGTYPIGVAAEGEFAVVQNGNLVSLTGAGNGNVTISTVSASQVTGNFNATFGADTLSGTFTASSACPALPGLLLAGP